MSSEPRDFQPGAVAIDDASIPLLTERILAPTARDRATLLQALAPAVPPSPDRPSGEARTENAVPAMAEQEAAAVETEVTEGAATARREPLAPGAAQAAAASGLATMEAAELPSVAEAPAPQEPAEPVTGEPSAAVDEAARLDALRDAVVARLSARLPETIDAAVREVAQAEIEQASRRIAEQARASLEQTIRDLVAQALREELHRAKR